MHTDLTQELDRRLAEIRADSERLMRYDINGDGIISDGEWEEVRRFVESEIATERARARESTNPIHPQNEAILEVLQDRYELMKVIGQGAQGRTYLAHDRQSDQSVAIKEMQMRQVKEWKAIDLFEREARVLKSILHPAIPDFIEFFHTHVDDQQDMRSFIVQEFVDGDNLKKLMEDGLLINESTARAFLKEMLGILDHLHTLEEPVIHRDIKPSNIIRRTDKRLALIDFGAVQFQSSPESERQAIVGTSGYMPLEQMMGRAVPATDLYALAATTVHLLSQRHPADLPVIGMALQFHEFVNISDQLQQILKKMLEPHVENRFTTANEVLRALEHAKQEPKRTQTTMARPEPLAIQFRKPVKQDPAQIFFSTWNEAQTNLDAQRSQFLRTKFDDSDGKLHLKFPQAKNPIRFFVLGFTSLFLFLVYFGVSKTLSGPEPRNDTEMVAALLFIGFATLFCLFMVWGIFHQSYERHSIDIDYTTLHHHRTRFYGVKTTSIPLNSIQAVELGKQRSRHENNPKWLFHIEIRSGHNTLILGQYLPLEEKNYLIAQIHQKVFTTRNQRDA